MSDITKLSLVDTVNNIKNKSISCEEVTSAYIKRINKLKKLNCYIENDFEQAINKAKSLDNKSDKIKIIWSPYSCQRFILHKKFTNYGIEQNIKRF